MTSPRKGTTSYLSTKTERAVQGSPHNACIHYIGRMMFQGKVKGALRAWSESGRGRVLMLDFPWNDSARSSEIKVSTSGSVCPSALPGRATSGHHPAIFERLNGNMVRRAALHCQGSAGPSGLDASNWRHLCTMFHGYSKSQC